MIIGTIALLLFLSVVVLSLRGTIPQDRLPIQTALLMVTIIIMLLSLVGGSMGRSRAITLTDLIAHVQLHPITALIAGFMVVGGLEVAATGLTTSYAEEQGFKVVSGFAKGWTKPSWFPGGKELSMKVLVDAVDGQILGAQAVGWEDAVEKIEVVAMAIKGHLTVHALADAEMAYCPATSEVVDPLQLAAISALRKLRRMWK